jgi:hypothetical protein
MRTAKKYGHRYPWDRWLRTGLKTILKRGHDYTIQTHGMAGMVRNELSRRGLKGHVAIISEPPSADQIRITVIGHRK